LVGVVPTIMLKRSVVSGTRFIGPLLSPRMSPYGLLLRLEGRPLAGARGERIDVFPQNQWKAATSLVYLACPILALDSYARVYAQ